MKIYEILYFLISLSTLKSLNKPFNFTEFQSMNRILNPILSPDEKYIVYSVQKWNSTTNKIYTNLQYSEIKTKEIKNLTLKQEEINDSSPMFSSLYPNYVFFIRKGQIHYIKFPPINSEEDNSIQLTNYPISINNFKIKQNSIIFSSDVYFSCGNNLTCSSILIENEKTKTYQIYDSLLAFHWNKWLIQGKGSHIFYQKIKLKDNKIILDGEVNDITIGMQINSPPLFSNNLNYDLSNDGSQIVFVAHHRDYYETFNISWKIYYINLNLMKKPILITKHTQAKTQYPKFSIDDTKIAYLSMKTPMLESENLHLEIYNILTNKIDIIDDILDISIIDYSWLNDNIIYFTSNIIGQNKIFKVNITNPKKPIFTQFKTNSTTSSYSLPFFSLKNKNILFSIKSGFDYPERIILLNNKIESEIVNLNTEFLKKITLPKPESFYFTGGNNDKVYGWIIKPINFNSTKKYPIILLIHGGPESSWTSLWSYSWNPQIFSNKNYVVIMINPHGSIGISTKFRESVRNNWGKIPYYDIMTGLKYLNDKYYYMDFERICAIGGSYGGYLINWIEGHNNFFKCLVNHDGSFSLISKFYSSDKLWFQKAEFCPKDNVNCNPFDGKDIRKEFELNSPERFVKNWKTPMLVIHGGKDYRIPLTEGLSSFTSLQMRNVDSMFVFFHLGNHWELDPLNQIKWYEIILKWIEKYIK